MSVKIAFVILQYMAYKDTIECVESIRNTIDTDEYAIIIVDNCSPDDSCRRIQEVLLFDKRIAVISNDMNYGFAKGNNIGYQYAKYHYNPEYIVMCNNDVVFFMKGLYSVLVEKYKAFHYYVLGPMIISKDGSFTTNPICFSDTYAKSGEIQREININRIKVFLCRLHIFSLIKKIGLKTTSKDNIKNRSQKYLMDQKNVRLHGSFLVFSDDYIKKFDGLDDRTFMYGEELFLQMNVIVAGGTLLYTPAYVVFHKEDASTDIKIGKSNKKALFVYSNNIISEEKYLDALSHEIIK